MPMVSHRSSIYVSSDEAVDAVMLARSMVARDSTERPVWDGVTCCLLALVNYNANSAEEFIANVAQEIDHMDRSDSQ